MKQLAEFFVRSAIQAAVIVALLEASLIFAWAGAAIVALWILRFGFNAAMPVVFAGIAGSAVWALQGELGPISNLFAVAVLASVLRSTRSWSITLFFLPLALGGFNFALQYGAPNYVEGSHQLLTQVFEQFKQDFVEQLNSANAPAERIEEVGDWQVPDRWSMLGWFAAVQAMMSILSLLVARWWQAVLYNPGGFATEMSALRFEIGSAVGLILLAGLLFTNYDGNWWSLSWLGLCILPLAFVGFVQAQYLVKRRGSMLWKVLFYAMLLMWFPFSLGALALLALFDAFIGKVRRSH